MINSSVQEENSGSNLPASQTWMLRYWLQGTVQTELRGEKWTYKESDIPLLLLHMFEGSVNPSVKLGSVLNASVREINQFFFSFFALSTFCGGRWLIKYMNLKGHWERKKWCNWLSHGLGLGVEKQVHLLYFYLQKIYVLEAREPTVLNRSGYNKGSENCLSPQRSPLERDRWPPAILLPCVRVVMIVLQVHFFHFEKPQAILIKLSAAVD